MLVNCPKTLDFKISSVRDAGVPKPGMRIRGLACPPAAMYRNYFFFLAASLSSVLSIFLWPCTLLPVPSNKTAVGTLRG